MDNLLNEKVKLGELHLLVSLKESGLKLKNQINKFGNENVFILTARAPESAKAIHEWLKSEGVNIPLKNITG